MLLWCYSKLCFVLRVGLVVDDAFMIERDPVYD